MLRAVFFILFFAGFVPTTFFAAKFSLTPKGVLGCAVSLTGPIEKGDADRLKAFLAENNFPEWDQYRTGRICLDSPGGSFSEGVELAKLFNTQGFGTGVEAGKRCESACALAFMGGTKIGDEEFRSPHRVLHPRAKLGFHAPNLSIPDQQYAKEAVNRAFLIAIEGIADILEARAAGQLVMPQSLLIEMLRTPADKMHWVENVGEAAGWEIALTPVVLPNIEVGQLTGTLCWNLYATLSKRVFSNHDEADIDGNPTVLGNLLDIRDSQSGLSFERDILDGPDVPKCEVTLFEPYNQSSGHGFGRFPDSFGSSSATIWPFMFHSAGTKLVDLPIGLDSAAKKVRIAAKGHSAAQPVKRDVPMACWHSLPRARIVNVKNFVNLRQSARFDGRIIREVPLGEVVALTNHRRPVFIATTPARRQECEAVCTAVNAGRRDTATVSAARTCVAEHAVWYEITDSFGNRGFVSRIFLGGG